MPKTPEFALHSLGRLARVSSTSTALVPLLMTVAEEALVALRAASISISRLEHSGSRIRVLVNVGDLAVNEELLPEDETYQLGTWETARGVMNDGITRTAFLGSSACPPSEATLLAWLGKGSSVSAAIMVDGVIWGEFYATRHVGETPFGEEAVDYVDALSAIVGAAISRSLRETELAHLAFRDSLTGTLNRRGLDAGAAEVFAVAPDEARCVTAVGLDINGLKQFNDEHGHPRGDELITEVARLLHEAFASLPGSLIARVGGDEFTVLVPDHAPELVATATKTLCRHTTVGWSFGPRVGISAGIASTVLESGSDVSPSDLLAAADRSLYLAKSHPSATVVVSQEMSAARFPPKVPAQYR